MSDNSLIDPPTEISVFSALRKLGGEMLVRRNRTGMYSEEEIRTAVERARIEANTTTLLTEHIKECIQEKSLIWGRLDKQDKERQDNHKENQKRFSRLERVYSLATIAAALIVFLGTESGRILLKAVSAFLNGG